MNKKHRNKVQSQNVNLPQEKSHSHVTKSEQNKEQVIQASLQEFFSGPLPHPETLFKYDKIIPNGAERIFALVEKQQEHRHSLETKVIQSDINKSYIGLVFGFLVALIFGSGGFYLALQGQNIAGLSAIFLPLATLCGIFIYSQSNRKKELKERKNKTESQNQ